MERCSFFCFSEKGGRRFGKRDHPFGESPLSCAKQHAPFRGKTLPFGMSGLLLGQSRLCPAAGVQRGSQVRERVAQSAQMPRTT